MKNKLPIIILGLIGIILIAGGSYYFYQKYQIKQTAEITTIKPQLTIKLVRISNTKIEIYLSPVEKSVEISAFQLNGKLSGVTNDSDVVLEINKDLQNQAWSFPIAKIENGELKIAGFRLGNSPYTLTDNFYLGTVSSTNNTDLGIAINNTDTVFYSSDALTKIPYNSNE